MRLREFAIDKEPNGDGRSRLIGSIMQLLTAGKKVDFFVPGIRGHVVGSGGNGDWLTLKRWNKPYSKINYSLALDASDDSRFALKMIKPDYYQVVEKEQLSEFANDDFDDRPKFIPWHDFIEGVKGIVGKEFDVVEKVVKSTIQARFVPFDAMEYGPTMLYSYYEARAGRGKGAVSTRGSIQVGKYYPNSTALGTRNYITSFNLLKGHPFERHFDLTPENISKVASIILGNTEGAYRVQPQGVAEGANDKPEAGDKITWYHSNHHPKLEGEVVGWKDGHLIVKSIDPSPRNTEKTVATYRVPKNNIISVKKQGLAEGQDERKQNALWAQITDYEKRAKATKNDIKKAHYLKMASELRGKLKTVDEEQLDELSFLGSPCTKDCSGHRAGYEWSKRKGGRPGNSPFSPSFNNGANLYVAGK